MTLLAASSSQRGVAMLLLLSVLVGGGALALSALVRPHKEVGPHGSQAQALANARSALLAYAVSYTDLYGPRGAGPGHFPCPDTDSPADAPGTLSWQGDGPNPPCGNGPVALGRLPRHISWPGHRYSFHDLPGQRLWYAVSTSFINNPVNRVVNVDSRGGLTVDSNETIVAVIIDPGPPLPGQQRTGVSLADYLEQENSDGDAVFSGQLTSELNDRITLITLDSLSTAMTRRVALWLANQYQIAAEQRCDRTVGDPCTAFARLCNDGEDVLRWLLPELLTCTASATSDAASLGSPFDERPLQQPVQRPVAQARSDGPSGSPVGNRDLLQGVPFSSHWFVRNQWADHVTLHVSSECENALLQACYFSSAPAQPGDAAIRIELVRVDSTVPAELERSVR